MSTLDGVLTRRNAEGEKQSITSRCADLNREVNIQLLKYLDYSITRFGMIIIQHEEVVISNKL